MPLRDDILNPVSADNPAGENLRYAPVYDKIKEARRQDDDAPQGEWQRERKTADYQLVIKLAGEAIATKSKDLQLAAWLTEALLAKEGYAGLHEGLNLIKGLIENFWEGLYPELEDGESEMRAAPVDWIGNYLIILSKRVGITKHGHDYLKYLEAKAVGNEPAYEDSDAKKEAYQTAISEGKMPFEEFEKSVGATSKEYYDKLVASLDSCMQVMEDSQPVFEDKFGEFAPSYGRLRESLEEVRRVTNGFLQKKIEAEGPPPEEEPVAAEQTVEETSDSWSQPEAQAEAPRRRPARKVTGIEPADRDEAVARVAAVAAFLRKEDAYSPAPYLMLRGLRWGELRAAGSTPDALLFEAPQTEVRQSLKRLISEGNYTEALEMAETAMAEPCGRAWLDLQRYVITCCESLGYSAISEAIKAELKSLIRDYPDLLSASLLDDTPVANNETQTWLKEFARAEPNAGTQMTWASPPAMEEAQQVEAYRRDEDTPPDSFQLATEAARSGRTEEAFSIMAEEIARQTSGRGRFQRKLQLAQICLACSQQTIAHSLLEELAEAIDKHELETWESPDVVAHALSLLYACIERSDLDPAHKARLYSRICRLDPVQALRSTAHAFAHGR